MKNKLIQFLLFSSLVLSFTSCKFYFSESEYLGTYTGDFNSDVSLYKDCHGQLIITDVGENTADLELITDSNATFYFTNVNFERGYSFDSSSIYFYQSGSYGARGAVTRTDHYLYLYYYAGGVYDDFSFRGTRQ